MADRKGGKGAPGRKAVPDRKGILVRRHMPVRKQPVLWIGCGIVLLILAAWHFRDVRAGVLKTGGFTAGTRLCASGPGCVCLALDMLFSSGINGKSGRYLQPLP